MDLLISPPSHMHSASFASPTPRKSHQSGATSFRFGYDRLIQEALHQPMQGANWAAYLDALAWSCSQPPVFLPAQLAEEYRARVNSLSLGDHGPDMFDPGVDAPDMQAHVEELDRLVGPLPLSLRAWYTEVGAVNFYGYHPGWARFMPLSVDLPVGADRYLMSECDPLQVCVLDAAHMDALRDELAARGRLHQFEFAEDPYFKDYTKDYTAGSSAPFALAVPNPSMDGTLDGYDPHLTFVEYLGHCIRWAGLPGMAQWKDTPADDLVFVTEDLVSF